MGTKILITLFFLATMFVATPLWAQPMKGSAQIGDKWYKSYQDKNGLWGFEEIVLDFSKYGGGKNKVRVKAQFDEVADTWIGDMCAVKKNEKWGFVNMKGRIIVPIQYEEATGRFVKMNGKWGAIDVKGNLVVPCQYDEVSDRYVKLNGKWGLIDDKGNTLMPCTYPYLKKGGALHIASENGTQYGYVDDGGKILIPFIYEECYPFDGSLNIVKTASGYEMKSSNAVAKVKLKGRYGLIDLNNKYVLYPKFKDIRGFFGSSPYTWVSLNGTDYGVANRSGRFLIPTYFREMDALAGDGIAKVSAPRYNLPATLDNNMYYSSGVISVAEQTYKDKYKKYSFSNIKQSYLNHKDSVNFGLIEKTAIGISGGLAELLSLYNKTPNGYHADKIAWYYFKDSLNQTSVQQGISWLKKGIDVHNDVLCGYDLSNIMFTGAYRTPYNPATALQVLSKAMSDIVKNPELLSYDDWVEDEEDALDIEDMLLDGFYFLGGCYLGGVVTEKNEKQAIYWYEKGDGLGSPYCALALGDLYYTGGQTVTKTDAKALGYYEKAAKVSITEAMFKAGVMYLLGQGTTKNEAEAIKRFKQAAALKNKDAIDLLQKLGVKN